MVKDLYIKLSGRIIHSILMVAIRIYFEMFGSQYCLEAIIYTNPKYEKDR